MLRVPLLTVSDTSLSAHMALPRGRAMKAAVAQGCGFCDVCYVSQQETTDLPGVKKICRVLFIGHPAKEFFAGCQAWRHPANKGLRQSSLCRVPALGKFQPSAKISLCRVPTTRQNMAAGKGGRLDGGQLPSSFAGCHAVRHPAKNLFNFF